MAEKEERLTQSCFSIYIVLSLTITNVQAITAHTFEISDQSSDAFFSRAHKIHKRDVAVDQTCQKQENDFLGDLKNGKKIDAQHLFANESKYAMALTWAGQNDGIIIIVTSDDLLGTTLHSTIYRSTDFGKTYTDLSQDKNLNHPIKKHNGLQRNPYDPKKVYMIGEGTVLYVTSDGGLNFKTVELQFSISGELVFHSNKDYSGYIMAMNAQKDLYISFDNGLTWSQKIQSRTDKVTWGVLPEMDEKISNADNERTIYATSGGHAIDPVFQAFFHMVDKYVLKKSSDGGITWTELQKNVVSYERRGKFLYASVVEDSDISNGKRLLKISIDCGLTWHNAQLPTIEPDRFFSVMDIEDNMIFMHVDDKGDTGYGTLYTSSTQGVVYAESLQRHLYPNFNDIHDFYKVKSIRGVYITSQMSSDQSIHTMITYNRGATWKKLAKPANAPCKDETKDCYLQLHGMYSIKRGIRSTPPLSEETAPGIIIAHGHVADALQRTNPDVYVTSDGGYNWRLSLKGPHAYQIGDSGGLLVAVPMDEPNPKVIKFSTDVGRCWHEYQFTNLTLNFTGLLTEPQGKSSVVMIWGYVSKTHKWIAHIIDFKDVIPNMCKDGDYEPWMAHSQCYLGTKETFLRLKKDSWCYNGYEHEKVSSEKTCKCTRDDYECDYGFYRPYGQEQCVKQQDFKNPEIDICLHGHDKKIVSEGYRMIPGDKCDSVNGFKPSSKLIDLNKQCDESSNGLVIKNEEIPVPLSTFSKGKIFLIFLAIVVLGAATIVGLYLLRRFIILRKHNVEYRYSLLNQTEQADKADDNDWDNQLDSALTTSTVKYQDSDEEELRTTVVPSRSKPSQNGTMRNGMAKPKDTNPFGSYHDDSDDDLLS